MSTMDEMPCHNPAKPCPDCPQKVCPEMGNCLVKSFQPLPQPIAEARLQRDVIGQRMMPDSFAGHRQFPDTSTPSTSDRLNRARRA